MYRFKKNKGFTLIELLVSIAIIGLLATLTMTAVNFAREKAKIAKAQHDIDQLYNAMSMLATDSGVWSNHQQYNMVCSDLIGGCPANNELCGADANGATCPTGGLDDEIAGIVLNDTGTPYENWSGPYMPRMPIDIWGHEYFFDTDYPIHVDLTPCFDGVACADAVVLGSYGPDGLGGLNVDTLTVANEDDVIKVIK